MVFVSASYTTYNPPMFSVTVRDSVMIAHRLRGEIFGPAQRLHGATYTVDVTFQAEQLDSHGIVVDIAAATEIVGRTLGELDYRDLDELPQFNGINTTTETLARFIFDQLLAAIARGELGDASTRVGRMRVSLQESHTAWAAYEAPLPSA